MAVINGIEIKQKIEKLSPYKFRVFWDHWRYRQQFLLLDFQPIITAYKLKGDFVLIHWQAKPKYLRRWGAYDSHSQKYIGFNWDEMSISPSISGRFLQIDESKFSSIPTAVICYPKTKITPHDLGFILV